MTVTLITTDVVAPNGNRDGFGNSGIEEVTVGFGSSIFVAEDVNVAANGNILDTNDISALDFHMNGDGFSESSAFRLVIPTSGASDDFIQWRISFGETADITSTSSLGFMGIFSSTSAVLTGSTRLWFQNDGAQRALLNDGYTMQNIDDVTVANNGSMMTNGTVFEFSVVEDATLINTGDLINTRSDSIVPTILYRSTVDNVYFHNSGSVSGSAQAIRNDATGSEEIINEGAITGDMLLSNIGGTLTSSGTITGDIDTRNGNDTILNTGDILGDVDTGANNDRLTNTGLIAGDVDLGEGLDFMSNAGTIEGDIDLGGGNDTFDGRGGTFVGTVTGGSGNDIYFVDDTSITIIESTSIAGGVDLINSTVNYTLGLGVEALQLLGSDDLNGAGSFADNSLFGNNGANLLQGRGGNATITGRGGDDTIGGGIGTDSLDGGEGNDFVHGGADNDTVRGDEGNDTLRGGAGNDLIIGDEGDDNIAGGLGSDTLLGNDGDDAMFG